MKKIIMICLILLSSITGLKAKDVYNEMLDSMLVSMEQLILNDLSTDSIKILDRKRKGKGYGIGDSFVFEVVFDSKSSYILTMLSASESMMKKWHKQGKTFNTLKRYKSERFKSYVYEHNELPYDFFEYLNYRFILLGKKDETFGDAIFGDYKFKATNEGLKIIDKEKEILNGKDAILKKYNMYF